MRSRRHRRRPARAGTRPPPDSSTRSAAPSGAAGRHAASTAGTARAGGAPRRRAAGRFVRFADGTTGESDRAATDFDDGAVCDPVAPARLPPTPNRQPVATHHRRPTGQLGESSVAVGARPRPARGAAGGPGRRSGVRRCGPGRAGVARTPMLEASRRRRGRCARWPTSVDGCSVHHARWVRFTAGDSARFAAGDERCEARCEPSVNAARGRIAGMNDFPSPTPYRALVARLHCEWSSISHRPPALHRAAGWGLGIPFANLDEVVAATGFWATRRTYWRRVDGRSRRCRGAGTDEVMARLLLAARVDELAARVVLQRLLPGLIGCARKWTARRRGGSSEAFDELLSAAWTVIREFPVERRPRHLVVEPAARQRVHRAFRRTQPPAAGARVHRAATSSTCRRVADRRSSRCRNWPTSSPARDHC